VRILAATNRDLGAAIAGGQFRSDLFYRLAVIQIDLPDLADRRDDILPLARHFLAERLPAGAMPPAISAAAEKVLLAHRWPGNVRELRNAMEHAAVVSGGGQIFPSHLPEGIGPGQRGEGFSQGGEGSIDNAREFSQAVGRYVDAFSAVEGDLYRRAIEPVERELIRRALEQSGGNQSEAAAKLGLHRNTLRNKLKEFGME
jgi:two-component system nitrogen regulation response regulator GlnG